jgi:hypothetical protein
MLKNIVQVAQTPLPYSRNERYSWPWKIVQLRAAEALDASQHMLAPANWA